MFKAEDEGGEEVGEKRRQKKILGIGLLLPIVDRIR
jgi:hypothetical protein